MKTTVIPSGHAVIIAVAGRLDAASAPQLKKEFGELLHDNRSFIFDLKDMDFIDSTGLGCIVACLKSAVEADGNIKLVNLQEKPRMVFEITRAYKIFEIFDNVDTAAESYN
ncbi:MAG: STAS domain-containing protein [Victivallales bacterium]|nr:STAS domain-containing protein [Victivallales bacterium]